MSYLVVNTKTAAQFTADNPVLLPNQTGIETDSLLTKIGDGQTAWNSLYYDTPVKGAFEQTLSALKYRVPSSYAVTQAIAAIGAATTLAAVLATGRNADATGTILTSAAAPSIHVNNRVLYEAGGVATIKWGLQVLQNTSGAPTLDWENRNLNVGQWDYDADYSASYTSRSLIDKGYAAATFAPIAVPLTATYVGFGSGANALTGSANLVWTGTQLTVNGTTSSTGYQISGAAGSGKILRGNGTSFIASTATYPDTATTTGAYLRANGTNWISSTLILPNAITANYVVYATASNTYGSSANLQHDGTTLFIGGNSSTLSGEILSVQKNQNANTGFYVANTTAGTASRASFGMTTTNKFGLFMNAFSPSYTTSGTSIAGTSALFSDQTVGFNIGTIAATPFSLYSNSTERIRLLSSGEFLIGGTAQVGSEQLLLRKDQNAGTRQIICNATSGTGAYAHLLVTPSSSLSTYLGVATFSAGYTTSGIAVANTGVIYTNQSAGLNVGTTSNTQLSFWTNNTKKVSIPAAGGLVIGTAALATTATDGFLYIPTCAGTPTGVPTAQTGTVAMVFDTTNNKLYIYDGGWLGGTTPGAFT